MSEEKQWAYLYCFAAKRKDGTIIDHFSIAGTYIEPFNKLTHSDISNISELIHWRCLTGDTLTQEQIEEFEKIVLTGVVPLGSYDETFIRTDEDILDDVEEDSIEEHNIISDLKIVLKSEILDQINSVMTTPDEKIDLINKTEIFINKITYKKLIKSMAKATITAWS